MSQWVVCKSCSGSGEDHNFDPCQACQGTGRGDIRVIRQGDPENHKKAMDAAAEAMESSTA